MGVSDLDVAAIRDRAGTSYNSWSDDEVIDLCDEVDRLRARLAEVEAELADVTEGYNSQVRIGRHHYQRAEKAEARLAAVEALCGAWEGEYRREVTLAWVASNIRAAARGEGDRWSECPTCGVAVHVYRDEAREALAEARLSREATEKAVARLVEVEAERDTARTNGQAVYDRMVWLERSLAAVEALCEEWVRDGILDILVAEVRAAAREGDRG